MKIYFALIGSRSTIYEHKAIAFCLENQSKTLPEAARLRFFKSFRKIYEKHLINSESYELLSFLKGKIEYLQSIENK